MISPRNSVRHKISSQPTAVAPLPDAYSPAFFSPRALRPLFSLTPSSDRILPIPQSFLPP